jgi:hypothetical protein
MKVVGGHGYKDDRIYRGWESCHAANCFIAEGPSDTPQNQPENASSIPRIRAGPYPRFIEMEYHGNTFI